LGNEKGQTAVVRAGRQLPAAKQQESTLTNDAVAKRETLSARVRNSVQPQAALSGLNAAVLRIQVAET
jgi:hypothetical protein